MIKQSNVRQTNRYLFQILNANGTACISFKINEPIKSTEFIQFYVK